MLPAMFSLLLLIAVADPTPPPIAATGPIKVYFTPLAAGPEAVPAVVALLQDKLLFSSRRHAGYALFGASDLQRVLDADAARAAMDCTADSCLTEIADAIGAPQLITGQLGRIGDTWVITLTRTRREDMTALARVAREAKGTSPEGLLPQIDGMMDDLFGAAMVAPTSAASVLVPIGGSIVGGGLAVAAIGGIVLGLNYLSYQTDTTDVGGQAQFKGKAEDLAPWQEARNTQQLVGAAVAVVGGIVAAGGLGMLVVGLVGGE
jgi:hypothetical protein